LKEVNVKDGNKEILNIGNIDILLNLIGLWNSNVNVEKLIISDANIFNEIDSLGNKPHLFGGNKKLKQTPAGIRRTSTQKTLSLKTVEFI
jgi:hypothetical protein